MERERTLLSDTAALLADPQTAAITGLSPDDCTSFGQLVAALLGQAAGGNDTIAGIARDLLTDAAPRNAALRDITETARRNFEPGGAAATLLFARGVHATLAHRVAHGLWQDGQHSLALAVKSQLGRVLATDIHPAARIGTGFWLDHGLGFVMGETAVIEDDVSIWHNVTLGSTLSDSGPERHPHICRGAVIGAGAIILGHVTIGAGANVAAGAIVLTDVPAGQSAIGHKATTGRPARVSFIERNGG